MKVFLSNAKRILCASLTIVLFTAISFNAQALDIFDDKTKKLLGTVGSSLLANSQAPVNLSAKSKDKSNSAKPDFYFDYDPSLSPKVRERLVQELISEAKQQGQVLTDAEKKELADGLKQIDIMRDIGGALKAKGLPPHSVATGLAYWLVINLEIVYGRQYTDEQNATTLRDMEQLMADNPAIAEMSNREKQFSTELVMWIGTLQYQGYSQAKDKAEKKKIADNTRAMLKGLNINPDLEDFTPKGSTW